MARDALKPLAVLLLACWPLPAQTGDSLAGSWNGALEAGGTRLRLALHMSEQGGLAAHIDSVDQGAMRIPVTSVTRAGSVLRLQLRQLNASYEGRLSPEGDRIEGEWRQGGATLPLVWRRGELPPRPQEPAKPYPYRAEEVVIENTSAGVKLAGTLTLPSRSPAPAVVLLTGSGAQDRDETAFGHRPFLVLADHLTRRGFAVLRTDDRGVGGSGGDLAEAALEDLAGDALAAVGFLQKRREIDPGRIGLAGHSEGGLVAPLAALRSPAVAFLVLMAAPGVPAEQVMYSQSSLLGGEMAEKNRTLQVQLFAAVKETEDRAAREKRLRAITGKFLAELGPEARRAAGGIERMFDSQVRTMASPAFRSLLEHDPARILAKVKVPVLVLSGARDLQVKPELNLPPLVSALESGGNREYAIVKLADLNHLFQTSRSGAVNEYARLEETFSPKALDWISQWLTVISTGNARPD